MNLIERLWSKIERGAPEVCWLWRAGVSRSGRREVDYGCLREGPRGSKRWRAHRLVLMLKTAPTECPMDDGESLIEWLRRVDRCYSHMEASHSCDVSLCCNPEHLEWQTHTENVTSQTKRRRAA